MGCFGDCIFCQKIMRKLYIGLIFMILTVSGFWLGFWFEGRVLNSGKQPIPILSSKENLPLPEELITNPTVDKLMANTEGKVVEKKVSDFTLEKDGIKLKIYLEDERGITRFRFETPQGFEDIGYEDIKVGDYLQGGISVFTSQSSARILSPKRNVGEVIAHTFNVTRE